MKKSLLLTALLIGALVSATAFAETVIVKVNGIVCAFCAQGIQKKFKKETAIEKIDVNLETKLVTLVLKKDGVLADETIRQLIQDAGYKVVQIKREK